MATLSRRDVLRLATTSGIVACAPALAAPALARVPALAVTPSRPTMPTQPPAPGAQSRPAMNTRPIPRTKEPLPTVGLGTWQAFDVDAGARGPQVEVMRQFLAAGGRVVDSSPMYGRAESVVGDVLADLGAIGTPFLATKVWTRGKSQGIAEMERSRQRMCGERIERSEKGGGAPAGLAGGAGGSAPRGIDLMQIHNLLDWQTHLPVLREMKQAGKIRYLGVTHYSHGELPQIERMMRSEALDFIQIPYNLADRAVEARVLPAAADTGTAVLVMRPFEEGALFRQVKGKPLPPWAAELDCTSWAQMFLKFIIGHPAVTCPIPATADPRHLADNIQAGFGRLPDAAQRRAMIAAFEK
ncbi:MAG TPA: aldo/keto reductase [Kofleriaceae bacterium]|jgi:aryl-alcohol dehydrogenase-like predicted oxidoreductase|nr:aldo/keto reductase [Kofleriaceae bacterium]